jgi:hypothetical protein
MWVAFALIFVCLAFVWIRRTWKRVTKEDEYAADVHLYGRYLDNLMRQDPRFSPNRMTFDEYTGNRWVKK